MPSGPPLKDPRFRRRRNPTPGFKQISHEPRKGPTPKWPLTKPTKEELKLWKSLWDLPQSREWEKIRDWISPAMYVRAVIRAYSGDTLNKEMMAEVRQLDAKIGISARALRNLHWEIEDPEVPFAERGDNSLEELRSKVRAVG